MIRPFFFIIFTVSAAAAAEPQQSLPLPQALNDQNTAIEFEVDSTWHLVEGKTGGISGRVFLADPGDYRTVQAEVSLPVARFDTDNSIRDNKLREVMAAEKYPAVIFRAQEVKNACDPAALSESQSCSGIIRGELSIRAATRPLEFPAVLRLEEGQYVVSAEVALRWPDFGVEDPSIIVAKLKQEVKVKIKIKLGSRLAEGQI